MSARELSAKVEEQTKQLLLYEKKLKDVVKAYKGLEAEKVALEKAVAAFAEDAPSTSGNEGKESAPAPSMNDPPKTMEDLKKSMQTLLREKVRRESALQNDKKILLNENDMLKERLKENDKQADKLAALVKELNGKVKRIEEDRAREVDDHGKVLQTVQKEYSKEKKAAEGYERKITEAFKRVHDAESKSKKREKELEEEVEKWKKAAEEWKKKAEQTPAMRLLQDQMLNMKMHYEKAINEAEVLVDLKTSKDTRLLDRCRELEEKLEKVTSELAISEIDRMTAREEVKAVRTQLDALTAENERLSSVEREMSAVLEASPARQEEPSPCPVDTPSTSKPPSRMEERAERRTEQGDEDSEGVGEERERVEDGLRTMIAQLQEKMRTLEQINEGSRQQHETTTRQLRQRIIDLEESEEKLRNEMRNQMTNRIREMEEEMLKQRERTLELISEKDREIEGNMSLLVSLSEHKAPADPMQNRHSSEDFVTSPLQMQAPSIEKIAATHVNDSKNIYYQEELTKSAREIGILRNSVRSLEYRVREAEQSLLCRNLQELEKAELLKEQIRVLEGKLKLASSNEETEYLRNIFIQFLQCENSSGRRNILKAIGSVLRLSPSEMKTADRIFK